MEAAGVPLPSSGLWEQAEPGWRTAADVQRVEAWRAETNVVREGIDSPDALRTSVNDWMLPAVHPHACATNGESYRLQDAKRRRRPTD